MYKILSIILITLSLNVFAERVQLDNQAKSEILKLYQGNERLHRAFFEYDVKKIETETKNVMKLMKAIKNEELRTKFSLALKMIKRIKASEKKEVNNKAYHVVSMALVNVLDKYDLGKTYNVYYCPMLKMKWVQSSLKHKGVENPYADYMPQCGRQFSKY